MNTGTSTGSMIKKPTTNTNGVRKSFGPDGCQAITDGTKCGETKNLQIIKEFNRLYEDKMKQIDDIAGGDCIQAKVNLQQEWIKDLTEQNEMLVKVVEELEVAAAERVAQLEKKLQQSAKSAGESMLDMRDALTAEVADKHDAVLCLRREVHLLEEQCRKADQQTHFKDDIIKELRKEIKQLKQHLTLQTQTTPPKRKSRSPKRVHSSKTEPDTNVNDLKDGTIVIRDSETIGDSLRTQAIKEKFSDPANQTIVYICESVPPRQKIKDDKIMLTDTHDCDVSMDMPKSMARSPNSINTHLSIDRPRDDSNLSQDLSLTSLHNASIMSRSTIEETCIQYSRDILDILRQSYQVAEKKILQSDKEFSSFEFSSGSSYSVHSPNTTFNRSSSSPQKEDEVKLDSSIERNKNVLFERNLEEKVEKLAVSSSKNEKKINMDSTLKLLYENESLVHRNSKPLMSNEIKKSQREGIIHNKSQACNRIKETGKDSSILKKKKILPSTYSYRPPKPFDKQNLQRVCMLCGNEDTTLVSLHSRNNQTTTEEAEKQEVKWMNNTLQPRNYTTSPYRGEYSKVESKDVSFNENEIRAFSSPYPVQSTASQDVMQIKKIFRGNNISPTDVKIGNATYSLQKKTPIYTRHLGPNRSVAIPIQPFFAEPNYKQPKPLSTRTLRRVPKYADDFALSTKSQSLPSCTALQLSRHPRMKCVRPPVIVNPSYIGTNYLIDQRRRKFAFDVGTEKKIGQSGYVDRWSHFHNTY